MTAPSLPHRLDRSLLIQAPREIVFRYFTDDTLWAAWWGVGSSIDARPGGAMRIRYPNGVEVTGEVVASAPPEQIVFTYGFTSGKPMGPGESLVTIRLEPEGSATRLTLVHEFADAAARDQHVQGWRYQLSVFANVIANHRFSEAPPVVDRWFESWNETDRGARLAALSAIATPDVSLRDEYSAVQGLADVNEHISASQQFMPGFRLQRRGTPRHCQGLVIAEWDAIGPDGATRARGTNVFTLGSDLRIASVTGFWTSPGP